jgi:ferritin-like metal-binding protein YciE
MDGLLLRGLQDIYYAEQQITKALPKLIDKATNRASRRPQSLSRGRGCRAAGRR